MKIALVANTSWYLFNFRLNLMLALVDAGHDVVAVAPLGAHAKQIQEKGIHFEAIPLSGQGVNPFSELRSVWALERVFRRQQVDFVLSYTPKGNLYSALACISTKARFVPNVSGLGRAFVKPSWVTEVAKALYRLTLKRADRVFFQNEEDKSFFVQQGMVPLAKAERLLGSGVDLHHFTPSPMPEHTVQAPVFLLIARMLWDKGVGEFVDAAREVKAIYPEAQFQLLGFLDSDNPSAIALSQINRWCAEGIVRYLGDTQDVRPYIAAADCVVLPSKYKEGVPRTLLEAAASGRPVITTDWPGCRDAVQPGQTGLLCQAGSASDLANKCLDFAAMSRVNRATMASAARHLAERCFDERFIIDRYIRELTAH